MIVRYEESLLPLQRMILVDRQDHEILIFAF